jgi:release factor glutamine methyltransferase
MTLRQMALDAAKTLTTAGIDEVTARRDATLLACHVLGWDAARWLTDAQTAPTPQFTTVFRALLGRRSAREPIAYIVGEREFYGRLFAVTRAVLIPRPETELVIDAVLQRTASRAGMRVVDIGTGSGCLAITIAAERPDVDVTATEVSEAALKLARSNAARFGVDARIDWRIGDLLAGAPGPFDMIVSNPPYVPERDRPSLEPEVRDYEPEAALFAGEDGLDVIRRLVPAAALALAPGGSLVFEIGAGQADDVQDIVNRTPGLRCRQLLADLRSIPRVVVATAS